MNALNDNRIRAILIIIVVIVIVAMINPTSLYTILGMIQSVVITITGLTITIYLWRKM